MAGDKVHILAVDDDVDFLDDLTQLMRVDYALECVHTGESALEALDRVHFDAVLLDLDLGGSRDGFEVLKAIRDRDPALPVIMVTKDTSSASAVAALKLGASDYIDKSPNIDDLERRLSRALAEQRDRLVAQNRFLRREIDVLKGEMIGDSAPMRALHGAIRNAAESTKPVLIVGETGTGKELVARALRALCCPKGLFVAINCAAIPRELFEGELFGSERGAYSSSERKITGAFEAAADGLLFLDELTEIEPSSQAALLRVIEQREFRPLGGGSKIALTARVVASTNRDLAEALESGSLRRDLYYRFSANLIAVPPLRERREDIPKLAEYFLDRSATELKRPRPALEASTFERLCACGWPGNVRELENTIERYVISGRLVVGDPLVPGPRCDSEDDLLARSYAEAKALAIRRFQREYVAAIVAAHDGNLSAAAARMGLSRFGLEKMLKAMAPPLATGAEREPTEQAQ